MNLVDLNADSAFKSVTYPLDLVDRARGVMLDANRELFDATAADISQPPAQLSELSLQITFRLDEFSTLLSDTDFFSPSFSDQNSKLQETETGNSEFAQALEEDDYSQDPEELVQPVKTVIDEYNGLIEWLDSTQTGDIASLKADLFKDMDSEVLKAYLSGTPAARPEETDSMTAGARPRSSPQNSFSPRVSGELDSTVESALSQIGITLNSNGTLDLDEQFEDQFKSNFNKAQESLAGEDGFFTQISSAIDTLTDRESRFTLHAENDTPQVYTSQADTRVRSAYRENVASLFNTFA